MDLTALNAAKAILAAKKVTAGVMQTDVLKYYIPLDEVEVLFTEVASALTELDGRLEAKGEEIDALDAKIDDLEARVEALEGYHE